MINNWVSFTPLAGVALFMFLLMGCATRTDTQVIKPNLTIPPQMFLCEDAGTRPTGEVILESEVARYISNLEFTQKDCKVRLKEIAILVKCYNDTNCDVDKIAEYIGLVRETKQK